MRIALAQLNPVSGDIDGNTRALIEAIGEAKARGADVVVSPEMVLPGYCIGDLIEDRGFLEANERAMQRVAEASTGITAEQIDWLVPHQANRRIMDGMENRLKLPPEKVVYTIERHANTSAASVPLALAEAVTDGRIQRGQLVLMEAMGGGFTWGSALLRW